MPGFNIIARPNIFGGGYATGDEYIHMSSTGQFRHGPSNGIINSVSVQGEDVGNTNTTPTGSVVFAFTLESHD